MAMHSNTQFKKYQNHVVFIYTKLTSIPLHNTLTEFEILLKLSMYRRGQPYFCHARLFTYVTKEIHSVMEARAYLRDFEFTSSGISNVMSDVQ